METATTATYRSSYKGGLGKELLDDPMHAMVEIAEMAAPLVKGRAGLVPIWFVVDPALARQVLQTDQSTYRRNPLVNHLFKVASGENLFTTSGSAWKWRRSLVGRSFRSGAIERDLPRMISAVQEHVASWPTQLSLDPQALTMDLALDVAARMLFSTSLDPSSANDLRQAMDGVTAWVTKRMEQPWSPPVFVPTAINREFRRSRRDARTVVRRLVEERRRSTEDHEDLLAELVTAIDPETGRTLSDDHLVSEVLVLLFAGHETTASAAAWTVEMLARHPETQDLAHQEVRDVLQGERLGPAHVDELAYVRAVVEETMRLYPPAWGIPRMSVRPARLSGQAVRRFSPVSVALAATQRSPAYWDRPNAFRPERFLSAEPHSASRPFGLGVRRCIGERFATNELVLLVATLLDTRVVLPVGDRAAVPHAVFGLRARNSRVRFEALGASDS